MVENIGLHFSEMLPAPPKNQRTLIYSTAAFSDNAKCLGTEVDLQLIEKDGKYLGKVNESAKGDVGVTALGIPIKSPP